MKTRNGFVSNSSSSSFVLIGSKVGIEHIDDPDVFYINRPESVCFKPNAKIKEYIKTHEPLKGELYIVAICTENIRHIDRKLFDKAMESHKETVSIVCLEMDWWEPEEVKYFEDFYKRIK